MYTALILCEGGESHPGTLILWKLCKLMRGYDVKYTPDGNAAIRSSLWDKPQKQKKPDRNDEPGVQDPGQAPLCLYIPIYLRIETKNNLLPSHSLAIRSPWKELFANERSTSSKDRR